jgi:hypothetical protein
MLAPIPLKRAFLAATVFAGALTGVAQPNLASRVDPMTIYGRVHGEPVLVTATKRSAGAIESLQWKGVEFIDATDQGRHLLSALSFDGLTECDNPTEAGARIDGFGPSTSSSRLNSGAVHANVLYTHAQMAYWLRLGQSSPACGEARNDLATPLSSTTLSKTVRFMPGFSNVLEHKISFGLARPRALAQFEVLTAYMPRHFDSFYRFDAARGRMLPLSDGPGEQDLPVVLATSDGKNALGLFTPQVAAGDLSGPGYGRWRFAAERVTKSNVVFRQKNAAAGSHDFLVYTVFGTLEDVRASLARLHALRPATVAASD